MTVKKTQRTRAKKKQTATSTQPRRGIARNIIDAQQILWKAGLSALSIPGNLVKAPASARALSDTFQGGLKKLEGVFDQRVLDALARAAIPSKEDIRSIRERLETLDARIRNLEKRNSKR